MKGAVTKKSDQCCAQNTKNRSSAFCGARNVNIGSMAKSDCDVGKRKRAPFGDITREVRGSDDGEGDDEKEMQPIEEKRTTSNQKKRSRGAFESENTSDAVIDMFGCKPSKRCRLSEI